MLSIKTFFLRLILFTLPVVLITAFIFGLAIYSGEAMPLPMIINIQATSESPITYYPRPSGRRFQYKVMSINQRKPDIVAVGSSRVLQMRAELFNRDPGNFYNAGIGASMMREINGIIRAIDNESMPRIVLFQMDQYWFVPGAQSLSSGVLDMTQSEDSLLDIVPQTKSFWAEVIEDSIPLNQVLRRQDAVEFTPTLSLFTITRGGGYRPDGSIQNEKWQFDPVYIEDRIERVLKIVEDGRSMYIQSRVIDTEALQELQSILEYLHSKDIEVIGYMPPFSPTIYQELMDSGKYEYMPQLEPILTALFEQYGFTFFDFTNPARTGTQDRDTWDGTHPSEKANGLIYLHIAKQMPDLFDDYTDLAVLDDVLSRTENSFMVFPY